MGKFLAVVLGLPVLGFALLVFYSVGYRQPAPTVTADHNAPANRSNPTGQAARDMIQAEMDKPTSKVSLKMLQWASTGFGTVMEADFQITNGNDFEVKDFEIECSLYAPSGTKLTTVRQTLYQAVPANSKKTFRKVNMGFMNHQSDRANCSLENLILNR